MASKEDYLFRRKKSGKWYVRFQYPEVLGLKERKYSLGTTDYQSALDLARDQIAYHRAILARVAGFMNGRREYRPFTITRRKFEDGEHALEDGSRVIVAQGTSLICRPGGTWEPFQNVVTEETSEVTTRDQLLMEEAARRCGHTIRYGGLTPPRLEDFTPPPSEVAKFKPKPTSDELSELVERYIAETYQTIPIAREVRNVLVIFTELTGGKTLRKCSREDGVKLREHLFALGNKSGTTQKKVGLLGAALNYAAKECGYNGPNPFTSLVTSDIHRRRRDSIPGKPFTEEDMAKVRASMADWNDPDAKLLWVLCATTGMRRGEAYLIEGEQVLAGNLRCITLIPTDRDDSIKNRESIRMIPIPADAIPFLPRKITGRLFAGKALTVGGQKLARDPVNVGKRLLRHLEDLGVLGRGKNLKSTRHRAAQRMKNERLANGDICPADLRREILGHEFKDVHDGVYARGYPMDMLKEWIDVIGLGPIASSMQK